MTEVVVRDTEGKERKRLKFDPAEHNATLLSLTENISEVVPMVPLDYIQFRCYGLVGNTAQIELLTLERKIA